MNNSLNRSVTLHGTRIVPVTWVAPEMNFLFLPSLPHPGLFGNMTSFSQGMKDTSTLEHFVQPYWLVWNRCSNSFSNVYNNVIMFDRKQNLLLLIGETIAAVSLQHLCVAVSALIMRWCEWKGVSGPRLRALAGLVSRGATEMLQEVRDVACLNTGTTPHHLNWEVWWVSKSVCVVSVILLAPLKLIIYYYGVFEHISDLAPLFYQN